MTKICPWCETEFNTDNERQIFCKRQHKDEAARSRRYANEPKRRRGNKVIPRFR